MLIHRLKILLTIILSFVLVQGIMYFSENPLPSAGQISKLFTFNLNPFKSGSQTGFINTGNGSFEFETISITPTDLPEAPDEIITNQPTSPINKAPTPTVKKTASPTPTQKPKPTKTPKPTPTKTPEPITSDTRPGTSLTEIFQEISKRACIPAALLRAFQTKESGPFFSYNNPPSVIKIYNTYGWWKTGAGDPCFGLGYHTQTGIVPQDSVKAGVRCRNAVGSTNDIKIMGIMQISEWEEQTSRKSTLASLPENIDRRVLFDNALIFAYITRARVGNPPKDCNDWPDAMIKTAAEKHLGTCKYDYGNGNKGDYCADILKYYKQYK